MILRIETAEQFRILHEALTQYVEAQRDFLEGEGEPTMFEQRKVAVAEEYLVGFDSALASLAGPPTSQTRSSSELVPARG